MVVIHTDEYHGRIRKKNIEQTKGYKPWVIQQQFTPEKCCGRQEDAKKPLVFRGCIM